MDLNINSKVISVPCYDIFQNQSNNYKDEILGINTFKEFCIQKHR